MHRTGWAHRADRANRTGLRWIGAVVAPWAAGIGLLISFTATAGTESTIGANLVEQRDARIAPALPPGMALVGTGAVADPAEGDGLLALRLGEDPLRVDLKAHARVFPLVRRDGKRDARLAPGPSFARSAEALRRSASQALVTNVGLTVAGVITPGSATWSPEEGEAGFVAVPDLGLGLAPEAGEGDRPAGAGAIPSLEDSDGTTPAVPRAVALSSTTPATADAAPIEVAASSLALPGFSPRLDRGGEGAGAAIPGEPARHRYADLIEPEAMDREQRCLAEAVYFESRSEPEEGQAAVAQVVLNRVKSGLYPASVCGVVYQNRHHYMGCQFSFACEGKALRITDAGAWSTATRIAGAVIAGRTYLAEVGAATHYHADYARPGWSRRLRKVEAIGRHIFYQLKRGQT